MLLRHITLYSLLKILNVMFIVILQGYKKVIKSIKLYCRLFLKVLFNGIISCQVQRNFSLGKIYLISACLAVCLSFACTPEKYWVTPKFANFGGICRNIAEFAYKK